MRRMSWPWWSMLFWFAAWVSVVLIATVAQAECFDTPAAAASSVSAASVLPAVAAGGYRVASVRLDPFLHQRWALVVSCEHPEWPAIEMPLPTMQTQRTVLREAASLAVRSGSPVVRAGDTVELWSRQGDLRIEMAALAEQNGNLGESVRVRLMPRQTLGVQTEKEFVAVVRGPRSVEMQP